MQATAKVTYVRISPRKVQIVLDLIRNQPADKAMAILEHTPKAACEVLIKLLKSAIFLLSFLLLSTSNKRTYYCRLENSC